MAKYIDGVLEGMVQGTIDASNPKKELWNIFHCYDQDDGFGDAVPVEDYRGTVLATEMEIWEFLAKWDKPYVYDRPYADLEAHHIEARKVRVFDLYEFEPYPASELGMTDVPKRNHWSYGWDPAKKEWVKREELEGSNN